MALVSSSMHLSIFSSPFTTAFPVSLSSRQAWKAAQFVQVSSGRSSGNWKDVRYVVSMRIGGWFELSAEQLDALVGRSPWPRHDIKDVRDRILLVRNRGVGVLPTDQAGLCNHGGASPWLWSAQNSSPF
jgi:hypothetical protein